MIDPWEAVTGRHDDLGWSTADERASFVLADPRHVEVLTAPLR